MYANTYVIILGGFNYVAFRIMKKDKGSRILENTKNWIRRQLMKHSELGRVCGQLKPLQESG